jgi:hypothetical protein
MMPRLGSRLSQGHEIVAHHELGPHNIIFHEGRLVGFIDWDDAAPGTRLRESSQRYLQLRRCQPLGQPGGIRAGSTHSSDVHHPMAGTILLPLSMTREANLQQALRNHK